MTRKRGNYNPTLIFQRGIASPGPCWCYRRDLDSPASSLRARGTCRRKPAFARASGAEMAHGDAFINKRTNNSPRHSVEKAGHDYSFARHRPYFSPRSMSSSMQEKVKV